MLNSLNDNYEFLASYNELFEKIEIEHQQIMCRISERISELRIEDDLSSVHSSKSSRSRWSYNSTSSRHSHPAAEAAALKAKLKYIDAEAQSRAQLERISTIKRLEMVKARLETSDSLYEKHQFDFEVEQKQPPLFKPKQDNTQYVQDYVDTHSYLYRDENTKTKPLDGQFSDNRGLSTIEVGQAPPTHSNPAAI